MTKPTQEWVESQAAMYEWRADHMRGVASESDGKVAAIVRWALDSRALLEDALLGRVDDVTVARLDAHLAACPWSEA